METVVITGANRGIGLALTQFYVERGAQVLALCRQASSDLSASGAEIVEDVDLLLPDTFAAVAERLPCDNIDILINNAGILRGGRLGQLSSSVLMEQLQVNAIGALLMSQAMLPRLKRGAKVALITSRMGSIGDNDSGGSYGYRMSKAALNAAGKSLAIDLAPQGIAVAVLHPGYVQTDMVGGGGNVSAGTAAIQLAARIDDLDASRSGHFLHANGDELPW